MHRLQISVEDLSSHQKVTQKSYTKSNFTLVGAEAAPVDMFIGNTNPLATADMIKTVLTKSATQVNQDIALNVLDVKCLNDFERDPNPRSKCWKVTVPYAFKEFMEKDEVYPTGWSHRKFFPPKKNPTSDSNSGQPHKRQNIDPIVDMLNEKGQQSVQQVDQSQSA